MSLEITLWVDAIRRANDTLRDQQRKYEAAEADYDRLSRQLDAFDEKNADLARRNAAAHAESRAGQCRYPRHYRGQRRQRERDCRLEKRERAQPVPHRRGKYRAGTRGPGPGKH